MNKRDTRVLAEQVRIVYDQTTVALWSTPLGGGLLVWIFWREIERPLLLAWYGVLVTVTAIRVLPYRHFRHNGDDVRRRPQLWGAVYAVLCLLQGSCWGAAWLLFIPTSDPIHMVVVGMWIIGVSAAAVSAYPAYQPVMFAFFLPVVAPGTIHLFVIGGTLGTALGAGLLLYSGVVIRSMLPVSHLTTDAIRLNFELENEIEERRRAEERLREISLKDGLTNLANRRHFDEQFEREFRRAARGGYPLALILIDIDYFKAFNDTYGHPRGDDCLQRISRLIEGTVKRPGDLVARYGGEEIVVLLPHTSRTDATALAETIRDRVERLAIEHRGTEVADTAVVTVSAGVVSMLPRGEVRATDLLQAADDALYRAKNAGRNRVVDGALAN